MKVELDAIEIDNEAIPALEKELLDDLEETILEQIEFYRNNLSTTDKANDEEKNR